MTTSDTLSDDAPSKRAQPGGGGTGARRGLGRGLSALIPQALAAAGGPVAPPENRRASSVADAADTLRYIELRAISLNPRQPRKAFLHEELEELTQSVRENGVLQPIVVRAMGQDLFELIAGERRFRAANAAGLSEIPAVVRDGLDERSSLALALIENIQREDLNALETAQAYQELLRDHAMTQGGLAQAIGRSQPQIANALRLLSLPESIQDSLRDRVISEGLAKVILSLGSAAEMLTLWTKIVGESLTVRQAEREAELMRKRRDTPAQPVAVTRRAPNPELADIGQRLSLRMGAKVRLVPGKGQRGVIEIAYYDHEHLEGLLERLAP